MIFKVKKLDEFIKSIGKLKRKYLGNEFWDILVLLRG